MWKEFKEFIMTGNVIDFAIAVILAGAVGLVVNGFVNDIMMPIVGHFTGGIDFADKIYWLTPPDMVDGAAVEGTGSGIKYGAWFNTIINLFIVGFVLWRLAKAKMHFDPPAAEEPAGPTQEELLAEIRDALKK